MSRSVAQTHEGYIAAIWAAMYSHARKSLSEHDKRELDGIKLVYGAGPEGTRGVTCFKRWKPRAGKVAKCLCAICATGQESQVQLCGTVIHEADHIIAGFEAGHGPDWHRACGRLGRVNVLAAGTSYTWANFDPQLATRLQAIGKPVDGQPLPPVYVAGPMAGTPLAIKPRPCGAGFGTRGGKSRGAGSKSRYLLFTCGCPHPHKVRAANAKLDATCNVSATKFVLDQGSLPPAQAA